MPTCPEAAILDAIGYLFLAWMAFNAAFLWWLLREVEDDPTLFD